MEAVVIGLVIWFVAAWLGMVVIYLASVIIGVSLGDELGGFWGAVIGWILGLSWWVFAVVQVVLHIAAIIQLLN